MRQLVGLHDALNYIENFKQELLNHLIKMLLVYVDFFSFFLVPARLSPNGLDCHWFSIVSMFLFLTNFKRNVNCSISFRLHCRLLLSIEENKQKNKIRLAYGISWATVFIVGLYVTFF